MFLIADSGSTKCDWLLVSEKDNDTKFRTSGINPMLLSIPEITAVLQSSPEMMQQATHIQQVYFYGAGSSTPELAQGLVQALAAQFPNAAITVKNDICGAAFATCNHQPGIVSILGTGANSCYYNGDDIQHIMPDLGYILGDESSGAYYGRILARKFILGKLPAKLHAALENEFNLTPELLLTRIYKTPGANVFLASLMQAVYPFRNEEFVRQMMVAGMTDFIQTHILRFSDYRELPCHFVGSIAFLFQEELHEAAHPLGVTIGNVLKRPIEGIREYHLQSATTHLPVSING